MNISPSNISRYLRIKGWKKRDNFPQDHLIVFDGPNDVNGDPVQIVFPSKSQYKDYQVRIQELIHGLSEIEERPKNEIVQEILNPNVDRLEVRVISGMAKLGTLPFSYAATLINGLRDFLIAAACVEENPKPFYRRATKIGLDYANNCRFGQTKVGSFIVTIESGVDISANQQLELPLSEKKTGNDPFNRRVVKRIQRGLGELEHSVNEENIDFIVKNYKTGLNANMCEALLGLQVGQSDVDLEYSVNWSKGLPKPSDIPGRIRIGSSGFEYLESAAKILRDSDESVKKEISGRIIKLSASALEDDDVNSGDSTITIQTMINEKMIIVKVPLERTDYKSACDAHRDSKEVSIVGTLERVNNHWQLMAPEQFKVIN
ncbi:MAG: hypothetical protein ABF651_11240 [Sporolactobacillus sp.]